MTNYVSNTCWLGRMGRASESKNVVHVSREKEREAVRRVVVCAGQSEDVNTSCSGGKRCSESLKVVL